ncbi:hypothetical protein LINPERHAP1_LOCUS13301 [Linum perenne]
MYQNLPYQNFLKQQWTRRSLELRDLPLLASTENAEGKADEEIEECSEEESTGKGRFKDRAVC